MAHAENRRERVEWQKYKETENKERDKFSKKRHAHEKNKRKNKGDYNNE